MHTVKMKKPSHPGRVVRSMCLEPHGLTVTAAATGLGVSRQALNNLVNQKAAMSAEMAVRLEKGFGIKAEVWLAMQMAFDLAAANRNARTTRVKRFWGGGLGGGPSGMTGAALSPDAGADASVAQGVIHRNR